MKIVPFKTEAHINSLQGKMDEITVLEVIGDNLYLVDYKGVKCTAIFNWYVCAYYADDIYGRRN
ncbi:MAG: hypothetical protein LUI60_01445 [Clostridia bacterium]|nr:hypothetical protein [Clostridia bacterium]